MGGGPDLDISYAALAGRICSKFVSQMSHVNSCS